MVSLLKFAEFSEEGVHFAYPGAESDEKTLLLTPEKCMDIQTSIGSDIMMQLDDVVVTTSDDRPRNELATKRSVRWLDRAFTQLGKYKKIAENVSFTEQREDQDRELFEKSDKILKDRPEQLLYPITQGVLDTELRKYCLEKYCDEPERAGKIEGGAIGGLSGGEAKEQFCEVVRMSTAKLPAYRPRYVMGVGHPIDLLVCVAMGCDQFDCVWPTRIARCATALVRDSRREVNLKKEIQDQKILMAPLEKDCPCPTCKTYSYAYLQLLFRNKVPSVCTMISVHNIAHHKRLMTDMRTAILDGAFPQFCQTYLDQIEYYPKWLIDALENVSISINVPDKVPQE